jgi:hypothetical protein
VASRKKTPQTIGWREWIELPEFSPKSMKVKVDTGAQTSALHAFRLRVIENGSGTYATFELHPFQRSSKASSKVRAEVVAFRKVRSSNGKIERRPVIVTTARVGTTTWPIEITLTRRDQMGFRMLLGRSALRRRFVVDPSRSYIAGRPEPEGERTTN